MASAASFALDSACRLCERKESNEISRADGGRRQRQQEKKVACYVVASLRQERSEVARCTDGGGDSDNKRTSLILGWGRWTATGENSSTPGLHHLLQWSGLDYFLRDLVVGAGFFIVTAPWCEFKDSSELKWAQNLVFGNLYSPISRGQLNIKREHRFRHVGKVHMNQGTGNIRFSFPLLSSSMMANRATTKAVLLLSHRAQSRRPGPRTTSWREQGMLQPCTGKASCLTQSYYCLSTGFRPGSKSRWIATSQCKPSWIYKYWCE